MAVENNEAVEPEEVIESEESQEEEQTVEPEEEETSEGEEKEEDGEDNDDSEEDEDESEKDKSDEKPRNKVSERIDQLTKEKYELKRRIDELQAQQQQTQKKVNYPPVPRREYFQDERQFAFALGQYKAMMTNIKQQEAQEQQKMEQEKQRIYQEQSSAYNAKINASSVKYPDFQAKIGLISSLPMTEALHDTLADIDNPEDLVYALASDINKAEEILRYSNYKQARTLAAMAQEQGKRYKALSLKKQGKKTKKMTKVGGKGVRGTTDPSKMSAEQYIKWSQSKQKV